MATAEARESWKFVFMDGRCYLRWFYPLFNEPKAIIRHWLARGYREYVDTPELLPTISDDGSTLVSAMYREVRLDQSFRKTEPDMTEEVEIKPPSRGKWRWRYGRWEK